jgi:hypothetical protein
MVEVCPLGAGRFGVAEEPAVGGITPLAPVEVCVATEKKVVNPAPPLVVDAGTKLGPDSPPPLTMILVELP